jgi:hypothetical protein
VTAASGLTIARNTGVGGTNSHAVSVKDFDGDGQLDILITTFGAPHVRYFRNRGNLRFADVTRGSGLESFQGERSGAAVADFDRDGKPDVYLTSLRNGASRLYKNNGDGTFTDVTDKAGALALHKNSITVRRRGGRGPGEVANSPFPCPKFLDINWLRKRASSPTATRSVANSRCPLVSGF